MTLLDSSALMALLEREPGHKIVEAAFPHVSMLATGLCEMLTKLIGRGVPDAATKLEALCMTILPIDRDLVYASADLCPYAKSHGLSLGDRLCLAGARFHQLPVLTADTVWAELKLPDIEIRLIRRPS